MLTYIKSKPLNIVLLWIFMWDMGWVLSQLNIRCCGLTWVEIFWDHLTAAADVLFWVPWYVDYLHPVIYTFSTLKNQGIHDMLSPFPLSNCISWVLATKCPKSEAHLTHLTRRCIKMSSSQIMAIPINGYTTLEALLILGYTQNISLCCFGQAYPCLYSMSCTSLIILALGSFCHSAFCRISPTLYSACKTYRL